VKGTLPILKKVPGVIIRKLSKLNVRDKLELVPFSINNSKSFRSRFRRRIYRSKRSLVRYGFVLSNIVVLVGVGLFIFTFSANADNNSSKTLASTATTNEVADPLDTISSADIAVNIAQLTRLYETVAVTNNADSINAQLNSVPTDSQVVAKPQIVSTDSKSISDIENYVPVEGDSVASIAEKFGVTVESIRWSNNLTGNAVVVGTELVIPPVDGFVYVVKEGDTIDKIAEKYSADARKITSFNDAEIDGIVAGQKIVIPGGKIPTPAARYSAASGFRFGTTPVYGYNGYDFGYCTWYVANRRAEIGRPIPANLGNASTWKARAALAGFGVGTAPQAGAVIWTSPRDYYGHVGFVEEVLADGSVRVSEMNTRGWNVRSEKLLTPEQAAGYWYIY
jgi:N-acetylmuramoyl-L-alanine amidase